MYRINPGEFKHPIEIKSLGKGDKVDKDNIPSDDYLTLIAPRAKITNISGRETIIAKADTKTVNKMFKIRYPKTIEITTNDKVLYKEDLYNIKYVSNVEDLNIYLEIVCELIK